MTFELPKLPYEKNALAPVLSGETLEYHYGKHHNAYVNKLNELVRGKDLETKTLEELVRTQEGSIFNNAAQVWNHTFYWGCMAPNGGGEPRTALLGAIEKSFGSFKAFREAFANAAVGQFGSGWAWLVQGKDGRLAVEATSNAMNPLRDGRTPLLTCDVWEHAYYIDYRNERNRYVESWWKLVNWDFVAKHLA